MSWVFADAIANFSRAAIPDEYVDIGRSMKSPIPENSTISSYRRSISAGDIPIARQPRTTLRSPVRSFIIAALTPSSDGRPPV